MPKENEARIVITPTFRMYYPTLLTPRAYEKNGQPKGKPRYSLGMILKPSQLKEFKEFDEATETFQDVSFSDVLMQVAEEAFGGEIEDVRGAIKHKAIGWPIKKGEEISAKKDGKHAEHLDGHYLINCGTIEDYPPVLKAKVDGQRKTLVRGTTEGDKKIKQLFVGGSYAYAELNIKATDVSEKKYLTLYLNGVTYVKPGELIGGGGAGGTMDRYADTQGGEADVDPNEGNDDGDDEIPF